MTDLYRVLQVDPSADAEVVEAAYHRLARKFHPDVSRRADAEERIRELNAAYEVLCDPLHRSAYDRSRAAPPRRTRVRVVTPRPRAPAPPAAAARPGGREEAAGASAERRVSQKGLSRRVLVATVAGLAASVAVAAISAPLFSATIATPDAATGVAVVVVSSPREERPTYEPGPRRPTATPAGWPPPIYVVAGTDGAARPAVDLFSRFVGAARQVTRRLQGPEPPERPYNPTLP